MTSIDVCFDLLGYTIVLCALSRRVSIVPRWTPGFSDVSYRGDSGTLRPTCSCQHKFHTAIGARFSWIFNIFIENLYSHGPTSALRVRGRCQNSNNPRIWYKTRWYNGKKSAVRLYISMFWMGITKSLKKKS